VHLDAWELLPPPSQDAPSKPPTATLAPTAATRPAGDASRPTFDVIYTGGQMIDRRSIGNDVRVVGPDGTRRPAWVTRVAGGGSPESVRVTYAYAGPVDAGEHRVVLDAGQIYDITGTVNEAAQLGALPGVP
jgi:hypothetical protein